MKFYYLRFWKNQRIFCLTIRVKFLLPRKRFADARKSTFGKTFMVLLIAKIDTPWNYRFSSKFVKSYTSSIFAKNKCICKNLQSHKTFSGFSNIFFKNSRSTIEGNKKKYLKSKRKREHVFKRNRNIIYFYQKIKRDRKRLRPNLVLFFFKRSSTLKAPTLRRERASTNPFHTLKNSCRFADKRAPWNRHRVRHMFDRATEISGITRKIWRTVRAKWKIK